MSFIKNLVVVACFTLALLIASSYGGELAGAVAPSHGGIPAQCFERTAIMCRSDHTMCLTICLEKDGPYIGGYCSKSARSCYCSKRCIMAPAPGGAAGPGPAAA
ncbi:hypothetical protein GQ55_8G203800 [Panicum hallii var. hallii]|uniref:Knottin scorpion toxin-like domain-containing protein n=1 Tax=Panicum hallii var. hallii TaxID=1504633 RepID=A0A2T7CPD0_9POAL|nr:hypothetical protein GQ55_8G203800 [Panicum hallii var. hallii]